MSIPSSQELLSLVGKSTACKGFKEAIGSLQTHTKDSDGIQVHEPHTKDISNGDVEYFCVYEFKELGLSICCNEAVVESVTFLSDKDLYGKEQTSHEDSILGLELQGCYKDKIIDLLGKPKKSNNISDFYCKDKLQFQIGFCLEELDRLSYIRVEKGR